MECPLCFGKKTELFNQDKVRSYFKCQVCELVFVGRDQLISDIEEKKRYESHQNSETDPAYQNYLFRLASLAAPFIEKGETGLDFGCGRTLVLENILNQMGFLTESYDVYFYPQRVALTKKYDFIILSEVIEHLRSPRTDMLALRSLLNPGGRFFIKTKTYPGDPKSFSQWFYKRDLTHVQFFNPRAFQELSLICQLEQGQFLGEDVYLFKG